MNDLSNRISTVIDLNAHDAQQPEGTSTLAVARAIHKASWDHNPGRAVTDIPFFDALNVPAQVMLCDMAVAGEMIWDRYAAERLEHQLWTVAETYFELYTNKHPLSSEGYADWESAPKDLKAFWYRVAEDSHKAFLEHKHKPRAEAWMELSYGDLS